MGALTERGNSGRELKVYTDWLQVRNASEFRYNLLLEED